MPVSLQTALSTIGAFTISILAIIFFRFVYLHFLHASHLKSFNHTSKSKGSASDKPAWALVTGASDGIGRAFAQQLCSQGFNILLHGRNASKLAGVQKELQSVIKSRNSDQLVDIIAAEATKPLESTKLITEHIHSSNLNLTVLINNVGGGITNHGDTYNRLVDMDPAHIDGLIDMNLRFATHLTSKLLPILQANSPTLILNVGSATGEVGLPFLSVYSACKAFNGTFSRALAWEVGSAMTNSGEGEIEVLGILVGGVATTTSRADASLTVCTPETLARAALQKVGCGRRTVWAWWMHDLQRLGLDFLPEWLAGRVIGGMLRERLDVQGKEM